jgi:tryptophanyl-tRNA synthetase
MALAASARVFSGIQPSGRLHLGNYVGAVRNWVKLQEQSSALTGGSGAPGGPLFSIVDLHAMTMPYRPAELRAGVLEMTASLLACGLRPEQCTLFLQSSVREHTELAWLLSCVTPLGWLQRMTQFKDKEGQRLAAARKAAAGARVEAPVSGAPLGLLSYPVLQAADILLYRATLVPVGEDQEQHLELARNAALAFNSAYGREGAPLFHPPATLLMPSGARIMSLRDGSRKMSKSDALDESRINLSDTADAIAAKVRAAKTDSTPGFSFDPSGRPDKSNLLVIYAVLAGESVDAVVARFASAPAAAFKSALAELLVATLGPIGNGIRQRLADPAHLHAVLREGGERAGAIAQATMRDVRAATGYA